MLICLHSHTSPLNCLCMYVCVCVQDDSQTFRVYSQSLFFSNTFWCHCYSLRWTFFLFFTTFSAFSRSTFATFAEISSTLPLFRALFMEAKNFFFIASTTFFFRRRRRQNHLVRTFLHAFSWQFTFNSTTFASRNSNLWPKRFVLFCKIFTLEKLVTQTKEILALQCFFLCAAAAAFCRVFVWHSILAECFHSSGVSTCSLRLDVFLFCSLLAVVVA